ncbi:hypothetical protein ACRAWF_45870 [Streptomyces sp. L7]
MDPRGGRAGVRRLAPGAGGLARGRRALLNLSHHMYDPWIEGPDATRVLAEYGANNFEKFAIGQAKPSSTYWSPGRARSSPTASSSGVPRTSTSSAGVPAAQHWVQYHARREGRLRRRLRDRHVSSAFRPGGGDPKLFQSYQIQGPLALELIESVFGGPLPETKFFHSTPVTLHGRDFEALRHGMAGQAGYEFIGPWSTPRTCTRRSSRPVSRWA